MAPRFKVGDLVRPSDSEWAPTLVNGPYGDWIGTVIEVQENKRSGSSYYSDVNYLLSVPGSPYLPRVHEGQIELVQEAM